MQKYYSIPGRLSEINYHHNKPQKNPRPEYLRLVKGESVACEKPVQTGDYDIIEQRILTRGAITNQELLNFFTQQFDQLMDMPEECFDRKRFNRMVGLLREARNHELVLGDMFPESYRRFALKNDWCM